MARTLSRRGIVMFVAVWQFPFALVPRKAWVAAPKPASLPIWDGTAALWAGESAADWGQRLKSALGEPAPYWDQSGLMWGTYENHCIELSPDDGGGIDVLKLRIDLRSNNLTLVERLLAFAAQNDLVLLTSEAEPVEPDLVSIAAATRDSDAARFVNDPVAFFDAIAAKRTDRRGQ